MISDVDVVIGSFGVGDSEGLALVIATYNHYTSPLLNHDSYEPANHSESGLVSSGGNFTIGRTNVPPFNTTVCYDRMSAAGFEITSQALGSPNGETKIPHSGILGLAYAPSSDNTTFLENLCQQHKIEPCRFGLGLNAHGVGSLIFGGLDELSIDGLHTKATIDRGSVGWNVQGNVTYSSSGQQKTMPNQEFFLASELYMVVGPTDQVMEIFASLNKTALLRYGEDNLLLYARIDCDTILDLAFIIGSDDTNSGGLQQWAFNQLIWGSSEENNKECTVPIAASDDMPANTWLLGQTWLRGKYVDFDLDNQAITVANWAHHSAEVKASTQNNSVQIPLRKQGAGWALTAAVGADTSRTLRVDTTASDLIMMPGRYHKADTGHSLNYQGNIGPLMPFSGPCDTNTSDYNLYTDSVKVDPLVVNNQAVVYVETPDFNYEHANDDYDGIFGLSGTQAQRSLSKGSLLRGVCDQNSFQECRFGMALNSTMDGPLNAANSVGELCFGAPREDYIGDILVPIPVGNTVSKSSNNYMDKFGPWWAVGDLVVGDKQQQILPNQSIYFDFNSDMVMNNS